MPNFHIIPSAQSAKLSRNPIFHDKNNESLIIYRQNFIPDRCDEIRSLMDRCFPKPPRDVYERMLELYKTGDPLYTAEIRGKIWGVVYCSKNSKGGCLENLAVDPDFRGNALGVLLVKALLADNPGLISLTTRIPMYFEKLGFVKIFTLKDESEFMIRVDGFPKKTRQFE